MRRCRRTSTCYDFLCPCGQAPTIRRTRACGTARCEMPIRRDDYEAGPRHSQTNPGSKNQMNVKRKAWSGSLLLLLLLLLLSLCFLAAGGGGGGCA